MTAWLNKLLPASLLYLYTGAKYNSVIGVTSVSSLLSPCWPSMPLRNHTPVPSPLSLAVLEIMTCFHLYHSIFHRSFFKCPQTICLWKLCWELLGSITFSESHFPPQPMWAFAYCPDHMPLVPHSLSKIGDLCSITPVPSLSRPQGLALHIHQQARVK